MDVALVIPFQLTTCPHRNAALDFVLDRYVEVGLNPLVSMLGKDEPWSKGRAVNRAAARHLDADVLVIADADSFVNEAALEESIRHVAARRGHWSVPHSMVYRLSKESTAAMIAGEKWRRWIYDRKPYYGLAGGGVTVVSPEAFADVRGIDERFVGWGGEDLTLGLSLRLFWHRPHRAGGSLTHLWHPRADNQGSGSPESTELVHRYQRAARRRAEFRAMIEERPRIEIAEPAG